MSSAHKNLSVFTTEGLPDISNKKFVIVVAEWNAEVTEALYEGALKTLLEYGAKPENVLRVSVPGSFELSFGAQVYAQKPEIDAVIAIGCVIQGLTDVALKYNKPVIFGVLTPNTLQQALDRAGGIHGNKGDEAAITAIKMLGLV
jgi:6,7-dimethyl-8-ribityllumazine synthase